MFGGSGGALPPFPTPAKRLLSPPLVRLNRPGLADAGPNPGLATTYTELDCCGVRILLIEG